MPSGKPSDYHDINNPLFSSQAMSYGIDDEHHQTSQQNKEHEQISIDAPPSSSDKHKEEKTSEHTAILNTKGPYESDREPKRINIETSESVNSIIDAKSSMKW